MKKIVAVVLFFAFFLHFPLLGQACDKCPKNEGKQETCADHQGHSKNCTGKECKSCEDSVKSKDDSTKNSKGEPRSPSSEEGEDEFIEE